ncbi:MAG TPA: DUF4129 domain-containing protein [Ohtaekwangia sp.]|uniref:DUF4129 domain-containing protein n=1 Tax=Ohtaekwangia sp. TaxID=2066019 RepID=UPI002F91C91B
MSITRLLLVGIFLCYTSVAFSQEPQPVSPMLDTLLSEENEEEALPEVTLPADSSVVDVRAVDENKLNEMREDPDMQYGKDSPAIVSIWDRIKMWLISALSWLFYLGNSTNWGNIIVGIIAVAVLIYVILRLLKIDALKVFYGKADKTALAHEVIEENIHEMDFDKLIQEALARNEYRLAIRLLFLQGLKLLADHHHITWEPGKTNHDYLNELTAKELKTGFNELNFYFEYAWYGNFVITDELYGRVTAIFNNWKTNIR